MKERFITAVLAGVANITHSTGRSKRIECDCCGKKKNEAGNLYGKGFCLCDNCMKVLDNF